MNWYTNAYKQWNARPLVTRLTILVAMLLTLGISISSIVMLSLLQRHLITQVDNQLTTAAQSIENQEVKTSIATLVGGTRAPTTYYLRYERIGIATAQDVYFSSTITNAGKPTIPSLLPQNPELEPGTKSGPITIHSSIIGLDWRALALAIDEDGTGTATTIITLALPLNDVQQTIRTTAIYFALLGLSIIVLGGAAGSYMVRHALTGLRNIEATAGKIAAGDLTQRIPSEPVTTEVGSLGKSLNIMLSQVEQSFAARQETEQKIRRFVSDASHELRTPLAAIRGYGELYTMGGVPPEHTADVMGRIHAEATRMGSLVDDLLTLARLDEGRALDISDVDLVKIAENAAFDMRALDPSRVVEVAAFSGGKLPDQMLVPADRDQIQQVFMNIVGNIARYTPKGSPVEILLGVDGRTALVEFRDHGPGIQNKDRQRVFERFYRTEDSRARSLGGSGLGLAIVAAIVHSHHGNVELSRTEGGGLTVTMRLPMFDSAGQSVHVGDTDNT